MVLFDNFVKFKVVEDEIHFLLSLNTKINKNGSNIDYKHSQKVVFKKGDIIYPMLNAIIYFYKDSGLLTLVSSDKMSAKYIMKGGSNLSGTYIKRKF